MTVFCHFCNIWISFSQVPLLFLIQNKHLLFGEVNTFKWEKKLVYSADSTEPAPTCVFNHHLCCFCNGSSHCLLPWLTADEKKAVNLHWQSCRHSEKGERGHGMLVSMYALLWHSGCSELCLFHNCHSNYHNFGGNWNAKLPAAEAAAADKNSAGHAALPQVATNALEWK